MSKAVAITNLIPVDEDTVTFEVRSPGDAAGPTKALRNLAKGQRAVVVITTESEREPLDGFAGLIDALMPSGDVPTSVEALQARRNAAARWELLSRYGALTAAEVAEAAGSRAKNTAALASRWLHEGAVLAVTHAGTRYFPAFQFDESGQPLAVIGEVLPSLAELGEWQRALWFITRSRALDDVAPVDLLVADPAAVVDAARAGAEPVD